MFVNRRPTIRPAHDLLAGLGTILAPASPDAARTRGHLPRTTRRRAPHLEAIEPRMLLTTVVDLGSAVDGATPGVHFQSSVAGGDSPVAAINDSGVVVGSVDNLESIGIIGFQLSGMDAGYIDHNGQVTVPPAGFNSSETTSLSGINDSGVTVGTFSTGVGEAAGIPRAFADGSGGPLFLPTLSTFTAGTFGNAINNADQVAGYAMQTNGVYHAFLFSNGAMKDLGTPAGFADSEAFAINNSGQVVGNAFNQSGKSITHAFLFSNGKMTDLGTLAGFTNSGANAINDSGQVVGDSENAANGQVDATLFSGGKVANLGTSSGFLDSEAYGINNQGQIVGKEFNPKTGVEHAFLDDGGTMIDLNSLLPANSGWQLQQALAINNVGQVVGLGIHNGVGTSFLLDLPTPTVHLTSTASPAVFGQTVSFTATVTGPAGTATPTGTVTFEDGSKVLAQLTLVGGKATFNTSTLPVGTATITAVYGGGTGFAAATASLSEAVKADGTSTSVVSSLNPAIAGQSVTFTATVKALSPGGGTPTGTVTFKDGFTVLGTVNLSGGKASLTTSKLQVGTDSITAIYNVTTDYATSGSKVLSQVVKTPPPSRPRRSMRPSRRSRRTTTRPGWPWAWPPRRPRRRALRQTERSPRDESGRRFVRSDRKGPGTSGDPGRVGEPAIDASSRTLSGFRLRGAVGRRTRG